MSIDYDAYSRALNIFLDDCQDFRDEYADNPRMLAVASIICDTLLADRDLPFGDDHHPFNRYEDLASVAEVVQEKVQAAELRPYVVSFFHSGGANYDHLCDFLDEFWDWAENSSTPAQSSDDESEDSESEGAANPNESVIDLTESDDEDEAPVSANELHEALRDFRAQIPRLQIPVARRLEFDDLEISMPRHAPRLVRS